MREIRKQHGRIDANEDPMTTKEIAMLLEDTLDALRGSVRFATPINLGPSQAEALTRHLEALGASEALSKAEALEARRQAAEAHTVAKTAEARTLNARDDHARTVAHLEKERAAFAALERSFIEALTSRDMARDLLVEEQQARAEWAARAIALGWTADVEATVSP